MLNYTYILFIILQTVGVFKCFLKGGDILSKVGIIAEFNPLHSGHELLIKEAKKLGTVVCVISGNFVQRGDTAICEKSVRALSALKMVQVCK